LHQRATWIMGLMAMAHGNALSSVGSKVHALTVEWNVVFCISPSFHITIANPTTPVWNWNQVMQKKHFQFAHRWGSARCPHKPSTAKTDAASRFTLPRIAVRMITH
jgi:hypothetical protein